MKLNFETYKDKVAACWIGKNIGGTMGAPYEGIKDVLDIKGYSTPKNTVLPNDDLDLQLVWLFALEHEGPNGINASILGEYWSSYIHPCWNEYGVCKANMRRAIAPPMSGDLNNEGWKSSNGAWIRTELWACVAPALPELAIKYAVEDAKVDHGGGEGTFASAFVAGMQTSAFALNSVKECIDVGLSAIPESSRTAKSVRLVTDYYDSGKTWLEARNAVFELNKNIGNGWFQAPSNVAYAVIGLLYGENDFKKSMLTAINCGDDTDCTAATVGATLGILHGMKGIPADWQEHIGDEIVTISIANGENLRKTLPSCCKELTERVTAIAPFVLYMHNMEVGNRLYENNRVELAENEDLTDAYDFLINNAGERTREITDLIKPYSLHFKNTLLDAEITLSSSPEIKPRDEITVSVELKNVRSYENMQHTVKLNWIMPDGFKAEGKKNAIIHRRDDMHSGKTKIDYVIKAGEEVADENRLVLEITVCGRHTALYAPIILLG